MHTKRALNIKIGPAQELLLGSTSQGPYGVLETSYVGCILHPKIFGGHIQCVLNVHFGVVASSGELKRARAGCSELGRAQAPRQRRCFGKSPEPVPPPKKGGWWSQWFRVSRLGPKGSGNAPAFWVEGAEIGFLCCPVWQGKLLKTQIISFADR